MNKPSFEYLYGPVYSWRLGMSLGVDPLSQKKKICNFNCVYCQLGAERPVACVRRIFVPVERIINEIRSFPIRKIDYITFSGRGEPTLAKNLGEMIAAVKRIRKEKVAVITNASLLTLPKVRADLLKADAVVVKMDASSLKSFRKINRAAPSLSFNKVIGGLRAFRKRFKGTLALQIMFIRQNKGEAKTLAFLARQIRPDEVELNTPLRPCGAKPLTKKEMADLKKEFSSFRVRSVYDIPRKIYHPLEHKKTLSRHGKYKK